MSIKGIFLFIILAYLFWKFFGNMIKAGVENLWNRND